MLEPYAGSAQADFHFDLAADPDLELPRLHREPYSRGRPRRRKVRADEEARFLVVSRDARAHEEELLGIGVVGGETHEAVVPLRAIVPGGEALDIGVAHARGRRVLVRGHGEQTRGLPVVREVVELRGLEGREELAADLVRAEGRVPRLGEGQGSRASRHLVLAVGARAGPHGDDHLGPLEAHVAHHVADEVTSPARFRLFGRKGEVEVAQAEEMGMGHSRQGEGAALLFLTDQAQGPARFSPDGVAAPFPAGEGDDRAPVALVAQDAGEGGDDPPIVVGMRAYEHHVDVHELVARAGSRRRGFGGRHSRQEQHRTQRPYDHREPSCHPRCLVAVSPAASL